MFSKISKTGILMDNLRNLSLSVMASSIFLPMVMAESAIMAFSVLIGGYYGYRIEKQIHDFRELGGRIMKGKSWDYLMLA